MSMYRFVSAASAVALAAAALVLATPAVAASFTNGSFESGLSSVGSFTTINAGNSTSISNWSVTAGSVDYIGTYWQASDGSRSLDMSGNAAGTITQTFDTIPGQQYQVGFDLSGNPAGAPLIKDLHVSVDSTGATMGDYTYDTSSNGTTLSNMHWAHKTYNFTATSQSTTLTFASQTAGYYGPALDNVTLTPVCTITPDGSAAVVATAGQTISDTIDATGCDIGVYVGAGVNGVTINGATIHDANQEGVMADGASDVTVENSDISKIGNHVGTLYTPNGVQSGNGIRLTHGSTGTITGNTVHNYEKNGIAVVHGSSADITGNTVTGAGPVAYIAQNGIEIYDQATGSVTGNTVTNNYCIYNDPSDDCTGDPITNPNSDGASGILIYGPSSAAVTVSNNILTGNQFSVWSVGATTLNVANNAVTGTNGTTDVGIAVSNTDQWHLDPSVGTAGSIDHNTINATKYGVLLLDYNNSGVDLPNVSVTRNNLAANSANGLWSNVANTNGTCNWWGDMTGPSGAGLGAGSAVSATVTYIPWLTSSDLNGVCYGGIPQFVAGGGNIKDTSGPHGKSTVHWTFGGNVGMGTGAPLGEFEVVDHDTNTSYHFNSFSPITSNAINEVEFDAHGTTQGKTPMATDAHFTIVDNGPSGDSLSIAPTGPSNNGPTISNQPISGGNFQVYVQ